MTIRSAMVVFLRCVIILIQWQIFLHGISTLAILRGVDVMPAAAVFMLLCLVCLLGLRFAEFLIDLMTPKSSEILADTQFTASDMQAICFTTLGAFILYLAINDTIRLFLALANADSYSTPSMPPDLYLFPIVSWIIGLYLLVGAPGLRQWLAVIRNKGTGPTSGL